MQALESLQNLELSKETIDILKTKAPLMLSDMAVIWEGERVLICLLHAGTLLNMLTFSLLWHRLVKCA